MKKFLLLMLALCMCLSMCACGGEEKADEAKEVELTAENLAQYLKFSSKVESCNFEEGMFHKTDGTAKGDAEIVLETINSSGATFKNVTIVCQVWVEGGLWCGWEFDKGNTRCEEDHNESSNYKEITIELSSDGKTTINEALTWANYADKADWSKDKVAVYSELSEEDIEIKVISVSGKVAE